MPIRDQNRASNRASNRPDLLDRASPLALGLGITSVAAGVLELAAPRLVADLLGLDNRRTHRRILAAMGLRELAHGAGLLGTRGSRRGTAIGLWSRVGGDVLDAVALGFAASRTRRPVRFAITAAAISAIAAADIVAAIGQQRRIARAAQMRRGWGWGQGQGGQGGQQRGGWGQGRQGGQNRQGGRQGRGRS